MPSMIPRASSPWIDGSVLIPFHPAEAKESNPPSPVKGRTGYEVASEVFTESDGVGPSCRKELSVESTGVGWIRVPREPKNR